jgi:twitching motility protein PilI
MSADAFNYLKSLTQLIAERGAASPTVAQVTKDWVGAAFTVLGTRCVISADETRMIADLGSTIPLPGVKHWVKGIANIGGRVVAISDLSAFLSGGKRTSSGNQALIVNGRGIHTGLMIEQSFGGVRLSTQELDTSKSVPDELQPYVQGVFTTEDGDYALFDTSRLLTDAEFIEASAITTN